MKEIIPFKKDIIFKTKIASITDISLTHDYKIKSDLIEGEFLLSGEYKITEASVIGEEFMYNIPFSIALGENIKNETINLLLNNFDYKVTEDIMSLTMELEMEYEKKGESKEEMNQDIDDFLNMEDNINTEQKIEVIPQKEEIINTEEKITTLTESLKDTSEYSTYKVYIVRNDDTYESIAAKYNISLSDLMDYNSEQINIGDKVIIPYVKNEL